MLDIPPGTHNRNGGLTLVVMPGFDSWAERIKVKIEARGFTVDIARPEFGLRPSGEPYLRMGKDHVGGHDCVVLSSGPGTFAMLGQLWLVLRYLAGRRAQRISAVLGYLPLGRSDKDEGALEFALPPLVIDLMMQASQNELDRIIAADLHSPQLVMAGRTGLLTPVSMVRRLLTKAIEDARDKGIDKICIALPDDGAAKRVEEALVDMEEHLHVRLPVVFGAKRRTSGVHANINQLFGALELLPDALVLLLDDEIGTGGTAVQMASRLKGEHKAKEAWVVVTHGVFCGDAVTRFSRPGCPVDRVYVTDTIPLEPRVEQLKPLVGSGRLQVVSWLEDLAWIVYCHHWDMTLREMR